MELETVMVNEAVWDLICQQYAAEKQGHEEARRHADNCARRAVSAEDRARALDRRLAEAQAALEQVGRVIAWLYGIIDQETEQGINHCLNVRKLLTGELLHEDTDITGLLWKSGKTPW